MSTEESPNGMSRREFLRVAGAAGGGVAVGGVAGALLAPGKGAKAGVPTKWDHEADIVIVGAGGAGLAAAIEGAAGGAKVLVLEKSKATEGNTSVSGGAMGCPTKDNIEAVIADRVKKGGGVVSEEMARAWAQEAVTIPDWAASLELFTSYVQPASSTAAVDLVNVSAANGKGGRGMVDAFEEIALDNGAKILFDAPATHLIQEPDTGEILGVEAQSKDGQTIYCKARKGVVLAAGGYGGNAEMITATVRVLPTYCAGSPYCTGDGLAMGLEAGGQFWKMVDLNGGLCYKFPEQDRAYVSRLQWITPYAQMFGYTHLGVLMVNKYAKRFTNEAATYDVFYRAMTVHDVVKQEYPNVPCYTIFDEETRLACPAGDWFSNTYTFGEEKVWSADNSVEIERGWIKKGNTLAELATNLGLDPAVLEETVATFNNYCANGEDAEFARVAYTMQPLGAGPYYGVEGWPGVWDTFGSLKINPKAQVLTASGEPIKRLYAAGTNGLGSIGFYYIGSGCIADAVAFGRIAGRTAAADSSWDEA